MTIAASTAAPTRPYSALSALGYLIRCEVLKLVRNPGFLIPTTVFPIMFFTLFGLPNVRTTLDGFNVGAYLLASYGAYGMLSAALFSFGVSIAAERGMGWNRLTRVTPMSPLTYFAAKVVTAMLFGLLTLGLLFSFGAVVGGISLPAGTWALLVVRLLLGMVPFIALGLWIGYVGNPASAAPIAQLIFLPMSFASGLFVPLQSLPDFVQRVAPYLPAYHGAQLAWSTVGASDPAGLGTHLLWLAGYTALFLAMATLAYKRDEGKNFG